MDADFWHQRWQDNEIGFHEPVANPLLTEHINQLALPPGSRILVPLCGKSHDLSWLAAQGYEVIGVELSALAAKTFFEELGSEATITEYDKIHAYTAGNITILVGDIFNVNQHLLGDIDAIYDRAALVALPAATRPLYCRHLIAITQHARQLLINYEYDQSLMDGPPFSISNAELQQLYGDSYDIQSLKKLPVESKLKGHSAIEKVWLLEKH